MSLSRIVENTGNTVVFSFFTSLVLNMMKNRGLGAKSVMAVRSSGMQARNTLLDSIVLESFEKRFGRRPTVFWGSLLSGCVFGNRGGVYKNCKEGLLSAVNASVFSKLYGG